MNSKRVLLKENKIVKNVKNLISAKFNEAERYSLIIQR